MNKLLNALNSNTGRPLLLPTPYRCSPLASLIEALRETPGSPLSFFLRFIVTQDRVVVVGVMRTLFEHISSSKRLQCTCL